MGLGRTITWGCAVASLVLGGAAAADSHCDSLPTSALRTRPCDPREECRKAIPADLKGPQLDARKKECSRLPTSGVCHGPDTYNPQAECRAQKKQ